MVILDTQKNTDVKLVIHLGGCDNKQTVAILHVYGCFLHSKLKKYYAYLLCFVVTSARYWMYRLYMDVVSVPRSF